MIQGADNSNEPVRVLYVDDEKSLTQISTDLLEDFGYQVFCAYDGREALQLFQKEVSGYFSVVVTDESMPVMGGIELARKLKQLAPEMPVVLCSGFLLTMQEQGIEETNIKAVLLKTDICTELPGILERLVG